MVDQYYKDEDNVQDTPEVEFENLQAQERGLSTVVTETADRLNRVAEITEWLYPRQHTDEDAMFIRELYESHNVTATQLTQAALAHKQAGAFAKKMFDYHQRLARDYNDISDKMDMVEEDLEDLRGDFAEAMGEAYENIFDELHESIAEITGCKDWGLIYRLTDMMVGNTLPSDDQRALLSRLLESFTQPAPEQD